MGRLLMLSAIVSLAFSAALEAQGTRRDAGAIVGGKVVVIVHVVLRDDETPYFPVIGLELRVFRSATDSVVLTTDEAGTARTLLSPGEYRLVSARDAVWKGNRYSWSIPLTVRAGMPAIDLRESSNSSPNAITPVVREETPTIVPADPGAKRTASPANASQQSVAEREGFWIGLGMGVGSAGCDGCDGRLTGWSGNLSLGGTLSRNVLMGAFFNGWSKSQGGATLTAGTLTAGIRVYPSASSGFFLAGGIGVARVELQVAGFGSGSAAGTGAMLGLGWDIRVGRAVSITPFWNGVGIEIDGNSANFGQVGLGVTWH